MGILGIKNRTENWKTVQHFHGLSDGAKVALVRRLGEPEDTAAEEIGMELFWHGMRDYVYYCRGKVEAAHLVSIYDRHFSSLHKEIRDFTPPAGLHGFEELKKGDYMASCNPKKFYNNVMNTEVDIVLETPAHIYIGEAKLESNWGTGSSVLVHQLIRQYVAVRILVDLVGRTEKEKKVVPFVVTKESVCNTAQAQFMMAERKNKEVWLRKENILSWGDVNDIRFGFRRTSTAPCPCQSTDARRLGR